MPDEKLCNKRVTKLFRPPFSSYFGCRLCHDLTYKSCQEGYLKEKYSRWMKEMGIEVPEGFVFP